MFVAIPCFLRYPIPFAMLHSLFATPDDKSSMTVPVPGRSLQNVKSKDMLTPHVVGSAAPRTHRRTPVQI